jgi:hypothetical protein
MPRALFTAEAAKLLNQRELSDWNERCELLLADAFVHGYEGGPLSEFREDRVDRLVKLILAVWTGGFGRDRVADRARALGGRLRC